MDWEAIGAIGELIGAIAVLVSLVYLALQVKANTASSTIASRQSVSREFRDWVKTFLTTNPEHFAIGMTSYPDMPYRERADFCHQLHDLILFYQSAQAMHEAGVLPDDAHQPYVDWVAAVLQTPGGAAFWQEWRPSYNSGMINSLEARMKQGGLPNPLDFPQYQLDEVQQ